MKIEKSCRLRGNWLFDDGNVPIQVRVMRANEISKIAHFHRTMHEYYYVIRGCFKILVDGKLFELEKDQLLVVEPGERHCITEASRDLLLMLMMPPPVPNDKVIV